MEVNKIYNMDCMEGMKLLDDNSIDSIVTDPPYGLVSIQKRFGKANSAPAQYGKDGAFARLSKGFMGKEWDGTGIQYNVELWKEALRVLKPGGHLLAFGGTRTYHRMACAIEDAGFEIRDQMQWIYGSGFPKSMDISKAIDKAAGAEREVVGKNPNYRAVSGKKGFLGESTFRQTEGMKNITAPNTEAAKQWDGWGTALKPANEPICVARKPLSEGTVAENVLKWGTGGINIDGCRIGTQNITTHGKRNGTGNSLEWSRYKSPDDYRGNVHQGRFPANVILDEEAGRLLDEQSGDTGGASRFFYCAKASKGERGEGNNHPTVKPVDLMEYLIKLVTPAGGVVLDPFIGSGTTAIAAINLGLHYIGFELEKENYDIANQRIERRKRQGLQVSLL